jgi:hypothetical protein
MKWNKTDEDKQGTKKNGDEMNSNEGSEREIKSKRENELRTQMWLETASEAQTKRMNMRWYIDRGQDRLTMMIYTSISSNYKI